MKVLTLRSSVTLPDATIVDVSSTPEKWWTMHNRSGYIDPAFLAPDPDQPRKAIGVAKLQELYTSVKELGVREPLTVTPRLHAPWVRIQPSFESCFFVVVSGHRRRMAALNAGLSAVPIRVVIYQNEDDHRTDGGLLNACRDDLTELEQGYEFLRLRKAGASFAKISNAYGIGDVQIYNRINLTKLHPNLQKLLELDSNRKRILPITVGGILGGVKTPSLDELNRMSEDFADAVAVKEVTGYDSYVSLGEEERSYSMQKLIVAVIRKRHLNGTRAVEFVRDRTLIFASYGRRDRSKKDRYQPARRKDVLINLANEVEKSVVCDWTPDEFRRIFELSTREDIEKYLKVFEGAQSVLEGIHKILREIRDKKRPTSPEVLKIMSQASTRVR